MGQIAAATSYHLDRRMARSEGRWGLALSELREALAESPLGEKPATHCPGRPGIFPELSATRIVTSCPGWTTMVMDLGL